MKPTRTMAAAAAAAVAVLAPGCAAGGTTGSAPEATPTEEGRSPSPSGAPTSSSASPSGSPGGGDGEVYVFNTHGDEQGYADQEPQDLTASEFTTFNDLEWTEWGTEGGVGEGDLSGTWCLPECQDDPYRVPVELADPENVGGTAYFTTYEVGDSDELPDEQRKAMEEADGGMLMHP